MKMTELQEGEEENSKSKWKKEREEQCASETFCDGAGIRGWSALSSKWCPKKYSVFC